MLEFIDEKILGGIVAAAAAVGAGFLPVVKFFWRRHKSQQEATNTNSNVITIGGTDPNVQRIERLEARVDRIRDELTELRIKVGEHG